MKIISIIISIILLLTSSAQAYWGARPMGMGGAYTALADDANAAYWNPAGFAINPGVDLIGSMVVTNKNRSIGDNMAALKMNFETSMNSPFEWIGIVGVASLIGLSAAQYLSDQGIVKKGWGGDTVTVSRESSMADEVKKFGDQATQSRKPTRNPKESSSVSTAPVIVNQININPMWRLPWYYSNNSRPSYWDDRYENPNKENTPAGKAQFALGLTYLHDNNSSLDQDTNWYTGSLATAWEEKVAVGCNLNLYDLRIPSTNIKGFGADFDLGALIRPSDKISLGIVAKGILTTDIKWQNGAVTRNNMQINAGVALRPIDEITLAADIDNVLVQANMPQTNHYGVEVRPIKGLALRAGLYDNQKTAGASIKIGDIIADYTILGGTFARTQMIGLTWKL